MTKALPLLILLGAPLCAGVPAAAADLDWQRCRQIPDPAARLACYDQVQDVPARAPAAEAPAARSGLPASASKAEAVDAIESTIPGAFSGWQAGSSFTLANGQVWQVSDGSRVFFEATDPKVRVRRGMLSAFYLDIEGLSTSPRVRRLK